MVDNDFETIVRTISNHSIDDRIARAEKTLANVVNKNETAIQSESITLF